MFPLKVAWQHFAIRKPNQATAFSLGYITKHNIGTMDCEDKDKADELGCLYYFRRGMHKVYLQGDSIELAYLRRQAVVK